MAVPPLISRSQKSASELVRDSAYLLLQDAEDFFLAHNQEFLAIDLDLGAGILAEQDAVAGLDVERENLAFVVGLALADGDDFALLGLFLGGVRDDDAAPDGFAFFDAANQDAVVKRRKAGSYGSCCGAIALLLLRARVTSR